MREIRVWDKGTELHRPRMIKFDEVMRTLTLRSLYCDRYKIIQFTGLKDKNGAKIFEGDIVRISEQDVDDFAEGKTYNIVVAYESYEKQRYVSDYPSSFIAYSEKFYHNHTLLYHSNWEYEIIGNIYENKDLLK